MKDGDRSDPYGPWAWYWDEVAKEAALDFAGRRDVVTSPFPILLLTERVEGQYAPPSPITAPLRREFWGLTEWLPLRERRIISYAYKGGIPRGMSLYRAFNEEYGEQITQQMWSITLKRAEEWVAHLAPTYRKCAPANTLRGALKRVPWPDVLTAYVDAGSTAKASRTAGCAQDTVYRRAKVMGETEPMVAALMAWHRRPCRDKARNLRHRVHPKKKGPGSYNTAVKCLITFTKV